MARPLKKGFLYFSFDVDFFRDPKIRKLKRELGDSAVMFYIVILAAIYENEEYFLTAEPDMLCDLADTYLAIKTDLNWVNLVVGFFLKGSLFDDKLFKADKVLTSRGVQLRFQEMIKERARNRIIEIPAKHWLLNENETAAYIKLTQNESFSRENPDYSWENPDYSRENDTKESKVNKSKVNKSKEESDYGEVSPSLRKIIDQYSEFMGSCPKENILKISEYLNSGMEADLICALIDYCKSRNKKSHSYIMACILGSFNNKVLTLKQYSGSTKGNSKSKFNNYTDTNKPDYSNYSEQIVKDMLGEADK